MINFHLLFVTFLAIVGSDGYRILAVFPMESRSHNIFLESVATGLATRGHQVDVISHFKMKNTPKNYRTIIDLNGTRASLVNNFTIEFASKLGEDIVFFIAEKYGNDVCQLMSLDEMQKIIKNPPKDPPYDIVITEAFGANCFIGLGYILKVPVITVSTALEYPWISDATRNPDSTAFAPNVLTDLAEVSTFWQRLKNELVTQYSKYKFYTHTEKAQTDMMRKYLSPDVPNVREVEKSVAMTLVNSFHSLFGVRVRAPAFIDIAGVHIEDNDEKLSPDLQKWMDDSKHGVVYFSLGSMVLIESLPKETLFSIYASFSKLAPIRVLMKIPDKTKLPQGLPNNVLTSKWVSQIPVLRHNNTLLFISHGGLLGIEEAIYYGVPLIGMPIYADQFSNVRLLVKKKMSVWLDYRKITEQSLDEALNEVLKNPLYRKSAKRESRLFRDRPMTAKDTTNFWVEYIARNGPNVLRSPAIDLHWWQVALLDVYGFILFCLIAFICLISLIIKYALRTLFKRGKPYPQIHKKKD